MSGPKDNPFKSIGGVTPCPGGWLVLPGRLAGVTVIAEEAFGSLMDLVRSQRDRRNHKANQENWNKAKHRVSPGKVSVGLSLQ